ncbi:TetR/AcrR family transcriptional regulator [Hansschlegelia quercus]|uniref:TetR/AcrR family transcriptional regulator n=1 Tax=Hansschlegelia quercus TaxID=2528245 RepID=A0A4Q9GG26_9HYPH|nr:TetR/AcrR family transcriptional regulator [Hansschlegelia quercus]TBN51830.1 TetR/AcrR family transcriptional regulator [Hansschlegelia quercus]
MARTVAERSDALPALGECFREHGYEGASLALIGEATGLGKGSLYHFFPGGKAEMAAAVLAEIDGWFEREIFAPLREADPPGPGITHMFEATETYFRSGRRVCLVGGFALSDARDRFGAAVKDYFARWIDALSAALLRAGWERKASRAAAEDVVGGIQGAIVLARSLDDPRAFTGMLARMRERLMS